MVLREREARGERVIKRITALATPFPPLPWAVSAHTRDQLSGSSFSHSPLFRKMLWSTCCSQNSGNCMWTRVSPGSFRSICSAPVCCELINQNKKPVLRIASWESHAPGECKLLPIRYDGSERTPATGGPTCKHVRWVPCSWGSQGRPDPPSVMAAVGSVEHRPETKSRNGQRLLSNARLTGLDQNLRNWTICLSS